MTEHQPLPGPIIDQQPSLPTVDQPASLAPAVIEKPALRGHLLRKYGDQTVLTTPGGKNFVNGQQADQLQIINDHVLYKDSDGNTYLDGMKADALSDLLVQERQIQIDSRENEAMRQFADRTWDTMLKLDSSLAERAGKSENPLVFVTDEMGKFVVAMGQMLVMRQNQQTLIAEENANQETARRLAQIAGSRWLWLSAPDELKAIAVEYMRTRGQILNARLMGSLSTEQLQHAAAGTTMLAKANAEAAVAPTKAQAGADLAMEETRKAKEVNLIAHEEARAVNTRKALEETKRINREDGLKKDEHFREEADKWFDLIGDKTQAALQGFVGGIFGEDGGLKKIADGLSVMFEKWGLKPTKVATAVIGAGAGAVIGLESAMWIFNDANLDPESLKAWPLTLCGAVAVGILGYFTSDGVVSLGSGIASAGRGTADWFKNTGVGKWLGRNKANP